MSLTMPERRGLLRTLPGRLLRPLGLGPARLADAGFAVLCERSFARTLAVGKLAFLEGRVVRILIEDAGLDLSMRIEHQRIRAARGQAADVTIRGAAYEFLLLISRREDPDSLFFQRRLRIEGSTELGLHLKNFLDAWEPPAHLRLAERIAGAYVDRAER